MPLVEIFHPETKGSAEVPASAVPGWQRNGWIVAGAAEDGAPAADPPAKNASKPTWVDYAVTVGGLDRDQIEPMNRDDIAAIFHPADPES